MRVMRCIGIIYKKKPKEGTAITYPGAVDEGDESCDHGGRYRGPRALVRRPAHVVLKIHLTV